MSLVIRFLEDFEEKVGTYFNHGVAESYGQRPWISYKSISQLSTESY